MKYIKTGMSLLIKIWVKFIVTVLGNLPVDICSQQALKNLVEKDVNCT